MKSINKISDVQKTYPKPGFIAYIIRCSYILCLLAFFPGVLAKSARLIGRGCSSPSAQSRTLLPTPETPHQATDMQATNAFKLRMLLNLGALSLLCLVGGYLWYMSLSYTSIPANTVIYQLNCVVVFLLSWCFLGERMTLVRHACAFLLYDLTSSNLRLD